jgi:hypothetical protein
MRPDCGSKTCWIPQIIITFRKEKKLRRLIPRGGINPRRFTHHWPHGEKFMPARVATKRRQTQHSRHQRQRPCNIFRGNLLQFQVPTDPASRIPHVAQRHCPGVKSLLALDTTPRNHPAKRQQIINRRAAARAASTAGMTGWTNHRDPSKATLRVLYFIID